MIIPDRPIPRRMPGSSEAVGPDRLNRVARHALPARAGRRPPAAFRPAGCPWAGTRCPRRAARAKRPAPPRSRSISLRRRPCRVRGAGGRSGSSNQPITSSRKISRYFWASAAKVSAERRSVLFKNHCVADRIRTALQKLDVRHQLLDLPLLPRLRIETPCGDRRA